MIFHYPDLFGGPGNVHLLYSYLDDFLGGAGHYQGSLSTAMQQAAKQISCLKEVGRWMGLKFIKSKTEYPNSHQCLLGITLDLLQRECSLKPGKSSAVVALIDKMLNENNVVIKELQSLMGNTVWLSMLLPRIRSYIAPFCEVLKTTDSKIFTPTAQSQELHDEMVRSLNFLRPVFAMDPAVHINYFLRLLPAHNTPL